MKSSAKAEQSPDLQPVNIRLVRKRVMLDSVEPPKQHLESELVGSQSARVVASGKGGRRRTWYVCSDVLKQLRARSRGK